MRNRLLGAASAILAAGAMVILPLAANAEGPEVDLDAVAFVSGSAPAVVDYGPNSGSFQFNSVSCAFASTGVLDETGSILGNPVPADVEVGTNCAVASSGTFNNIVCGTGLAYGAPTTISEPNSDTYNVNNDPRVTLPSTPVTNNQAGNTAYTIVFVAGAGVLVATNIGETEGGVNTGETGVGAGVVQIAPSPSSEFLPPIPLEQPPTSLTNICTDHFTVTAVLVTNA